jgi:catechol 2,3-dioxygenase-like lactoylglutathione lyase family enzyme
MKIKLASVNLEVADPERSKQFYLDVLGMAEDTQRSHRQDFIYLTSEGCDMTLAKSQNGTGAQPSRTMELGFEVDDLAAMKTHLSRHGTSNFREESMGWGDAVELRDGDGYRVVVYAFRT